MMVLGPLGDRGFLARFESEDEASGWAAAVRQRRLAGVVDIVLAYQSAAVFADPAQVDLDSLENSLRGVEPQSEAHQSSRLIRLPVLYDGEDLGDVGTRQGVSADEVIALHSGQEYRVFAIGFMPGFPYAGYLPAGL